MKTILSFLTLCVVATSLKSQITGQSTYNHASTPAILSSGTYVNSSPGFIMAGFRPTAAAGTANFFVDKVNPAGTFGGGFSRGYSMMATGAGCSSALAQQTTCVGVSVIETSAGRYAVAAAFETGFLIAILSTSGTTLSTTFFTYPTGATLPTKPLITESTTSPGRFYVSGSFLASGVRYIYIVKLSNNLATVDWAKHYDVGNPSRFTPFGMVESNYGVSPELVIAGVIGDPSSSNEDALFMRIDGNNGGMVQAEHIFLSGSGIQNNLERFSSIKLAASNGGYIIGGSATGFPLFLNMNANGTINWWSSLTSLTIGNPADDVLGVTERFSTFYNAYEYYGAVSSLNGMLAVKIANNGLVFLQPGNTNNEFLYNSPPSTGLSADISLVNSPTSQNYGIHIFGTTTSGPGSFFLNQACFNGATGTCASSSRQNLSSMPGTTVFPIASLPLVVNVFNGIGQCTNTALSSTLVSYAPTQPCNLTGLPTSPYAGNNNRIMATSLSGSSSDETTVSIYPNPVNSTSTLNYNLASDGDAKIELYNELGQLIKLLDVGYKNSGTYKLDLEMSELQLENGVYFVKISTNGESRMKKIIYKAD